MTSTQKEPRELKGEQTEQGEHENKNGEQINEQTGQTEPETPAPELAGQIAIKGFEDLEPGEDPERSEQAEAPKRKKGRDSGALYFDDETGRIVDQDGNDIKDNPEALAEYDRIFKKLQPKLYNAIIKTSKSIDQLAAVYLILSSNKESGALFLDSLPQNKVEAVKAAAERQTQSAINAGKLQARAEAVESFLKKELQKKDYHGATLDALLYDRSPEALADPNDEKTKLLVKAIAAAERAAHQPREKIKAADRKDAAEAGAVNNEPKHIITITDKQYKSGFSFTEDGSAALAFLREDIDIQITPDGRLYFPKLGEFSEIEIENTLTHEQIESIDLPLLRIFYTQIVEQAEAARKRGEARPLDGKLIIDAGTLAAELGESRTNNTRARDKAIAAAKSFHNIAGKLVYDPHATPSYFQVLNFEKYDSKTNTITLRAPYLAYLFREVEKNNLLTAAGESDTETAGEILTKKAGALLTKAHHGHGIQYALYKKYRRNKAVLENLFILDEVIEAAGRRRPNITAREMIRRNVYFTELLKGKDTRSTNKTLKRIFQQTWQALRSADLVKMYESIDLPDPDDPASIPTADTLNICFCFNNTGKKKHPPIYHEAKEQRQQPDGIQKQEHKKNNIAVKQLEEARAKLAELEKQGATDEELIERVKMQIASLEEHV